MPYGAYQFSVTDEEGNVKPSAQVTVRAEGSGAIVPLYSNKAGTTPLGNPFTADGDGFALFFVLGGEYRIDAALGGFSRTWRYVAIGTGDRYDIPFSFTGPFGASEALPAFSVVTPLTLPAGLPGSVARCITAPTAQSIFTFEKSTDDGATWSSVFTVTFAVGSRIGTFTLAADATLSAEDMIRPVAPSVIDATLEGLSVTIAANR